MSSIRTRPTREQTRRRLLDAAAKLFATKGIGETSIVDMCEAAGFSRGAFYSNFETKDDVVMALLEEQLASNSAELQATLDETGSPQSLYEALDPRVRRTNDPITGNPVLYVELMLYANRNPANAERLAARHEAARASLRDFVVQISTLIGRDVPGDIDDAVTLLAAIDDGLALQAVLQPGRHRPSIHADLLAMLHELWIQGGD